MRFYPNLKKLGILYNAGEANSKATVQGIRTSGKRAALRSRRNGLQIERCLPGRQEPRGTRRRGLCPHGQHGVSALESAVKVCNGTKLALFCAGRGLVSSGALWPPWDLTIT